MRYFWAFLVSATAVVAGAASCSSNGKSNGFNGGNNTGGVTGNGASSSTGGGGSTGVGITFTDAGTHSSDAATCAAYLGDCAAQKLNCGMATDGCGNVLNCGMCTSPETCGGSGTSNVCGMGSCVPATCQSLGFDCGSASDGCNGILNCGTCGSNQTCGANNMPNVCGAGICMPGTCSSLGFTCGMQGDGCGGTLSCGTCASNQACNAGQCVTVCTPKTCAQIGATCGAQSDGCGGIVSCGTCASNQVCSGLSCGTSTSCTGYCLQQMQCSGTATTSISGTVFAPNGTDPLPSALVYVPNSALQQFPAGVTCGSCTSEVTGDPLVSTTTAFDGSFTLTNMPVGTNIPIVIQKGRWRREYVVPSVAACVNTAIPSTAGATQLRMPQIEKEFTQFDNIPLMAFVTGSVDGLECVLRKIGIADSQFSDPTGTGRVRFYLGSGSAGAQYSKTTPSETTLEASQATVNAYDMVYFACQGDEYQKTAAQQQVMVNYANAGGRIFTTHYEYVWLTNTSDNAAWQGTATWQPDPIYFNEGVFGQDPGTGLINTASSDPRPTILAQWLQFIGASTTYGQMSVNTLRNDFTAVTSPSLLWISDNDPDLGTQPLHYTFDTPWGSPPANQCGRVLYSDFHVEDIENNPSTGKTFPKECTSTTMTPQEKMLEFMLFDLGACVAPPVCTPTTCAAAGATCGMIGDGCGNALSCGLCPSGQACIGGTCSSNGCTPKTCADQNFMCGMQGDGCGNAIDCGTCPSGQTCGGGGTGKCGSGSCNPTTCAAQNVMCGDIGDGCGNTIDCGTCPQGEVCGGGSNPKPGVCGPSSCVPKTCTQQGFNCGAASDGCGNIIMCGTCGGAQTCGGGGSPNVCGGGA